MRGEAQLAATYSAADNPAPESLLAAATRGEVAAAGWRSRFRAILETGTVRLNGRPGSAVAVHVPGSPFDGQVHRVADFCNEHLALAERYALCLGVDLTEVCPPDATGWFDHLRSALEPGVPQSLNPAAPWLISLHAGHPAAHDLLDQRQPLGELGAQVVFRYDAASIMEPASMPGWQSLVEVSHEDARLRLVPVNRGRALSGLHAPEKPSCVLPLGAFETVADAAWLLLELDATKLGSPQRLRRQLSACLRLADNLIDTTIWHRPVLNMDALLNRRVAVHVSGIGELLRAQRLNPATQSTFAWLQRWLNFLRSCFTHESMLLARARGPFPQLGFNRLIADLSPYYGVRDATRLVRNRFMRHRHILALSPFAILPEQFAAAEESAWLNLLPAISSADVLTMQGDGMRKQLSRQGWQRLLHIVGALTAGGRVITHK